MSTKHVVAHQAMGDLKKSDCIPFDKALEELGVVRNTLNSYLMTLNVTKLKFPLDRRVFISKQDFERVKQFKRELGEE